MEALFIVVVLSIIVILCIKVHRLTKSQNLLTDLIAKETEKTATELVRTQSRIDMLSVTIANK